MLELLEAFNPKAVALKIKRVQFEHWKALNAYDKEAVEAVQKLLAKLRDQLSVEIGRLDAEQFKTMHLGRIEKLVNDLLADFEHRAEMAIRTYVPGAMRMSQHKTFDMAGAMRHMPSIPYPIPIVLPDSLLSAAATLSSAMIKGLAQEVRTQVVGTLGRAVLGVQTPFETARQIATIVGPRGNVGAMASAERIVRTEVGRAYSVADEFFDNAATKFRPADLPKLMKIWVTMNDDRVRHSHEYMHKKVVGVDEKFVVPKVRVIKGVPTRVGSEEMSRPQDVGGSAGNVINCRCTSITVPEDILDEMLARLPGEPGEL